MLDYDHRYFVTARSLTACIYLAGVRRDGLQSLFRTVGRHESFPNAVLRPSRLDTLDFGQGRTRSGRTMSLGPVYGTAFAVSNWMYRTIKKDRREDMKWGLTSSQALPITLCWSGGASFRLVAVLDVWAQRWVARVLIFDICVDSRTIEPSSLLAKFTNDTLMLINIGQ